MTERVVVVLRQEEYEVDDDSPRHYQLKWEDGVHLFDEASPDGFVPEVEACSCLLILRNGDPGLIRFIFHHALLSASEPIDLKSDDGFKPSTAKHWWYFAL